MGLGGCVKLLLYFLEGGGSGQPGNPSGYTLGIPSLTAPNRHGYIPQGFLKVFAGGGNRIDLGEGIHMRM